MLPMLMSSRSSNMKAIVNNTGIIRKVEAYYNMLKHTGNHSIVSKLGIANEVVSENVTKLIRDSEAMYSNMQVHVCIKVELVYATHNQ